MENLVNKHVDIAIAIFAFRRPNTLKQLLNSLELNGSLDTFTIYCFVDYPVLEADSAKNTEVLKILRSFGTRHAIKIFQARHNLSVNLSIRSGLQKVLNEHEAVIVLEDDLIVSKYFLSYMRNALTKYRYKTQVFSISGYKYPISSDHKGFFLTGADCWGWATWANRWTLVEWNVMKIIANLARKGRMKRFNLDGKGPFTGMLINSMLGLNNSWAIRVHAWALSNKYLTLYPGNSLVKNIGFDGSGSHSGTTNVYDVKISDLAEPLIDIEIEENREIFMEYSKFFTSKITSNKPNYLSIGTVKALILKTNLFIKSKNFEKNYRLLES